MSLDSVTKIRKGKNLKTIIEEEYRTTEFSETANLDTKMLEEAGSNYEEVFIRIRDLLKGKPWCCCDDENDRLSIAQVISDTLRKSQLIRKDL